MTTRSVRRILFGLWLVAVMFAGANTPLVQELEANCCCPVSRHSIREAPIFYSMSPTSGCSARRPVCIMEFCCTFTSKWCSGGRIYYTCDRVKSCTDRNA